MPVAVKTSVSVPADAPALPVLERIAPVAKALLAQPCPAAPVLPHGQAAPVPSPRQNAVVGVLTGTSSVMIAVVLSLNVTFRPILPLCMNVMPAPSELLYGSSP